MGKSTVFANKQGISSANSGAVSTSGPDVCLTQVGNAVVPIPYTNTARSSTLENGSKSVKVDGASAAIDGCCYSSSTGDQAGSKKGVISGTVGDKAEFANCSFDVCIEDKGACRNMDLMTHNNGNAIGTNRDSSADPPKSKQDPPPLDTVRIKVVEHLSWNKYDDKSKTFYLGQENNEPIAGREFIIKLPNGSEMKKTTDDKGIIELTGQDPHGKFELTLETEDAKLNKKYFLFSKAITPFKKSRVEQDDPKGEKIRHTKDDIVTGVNYVASIYQPCVIVDCHMHIQSGRCATLPFLWGGAPAGLSVVATRLQPGRVTVETTGDIYGTSADWLFLKPVTGAIVKGLEKLGNMANPAPQTVPVPVDRSELYRKHELRQMLEVSQNKTDKIGTKEFMKKMNQVYKECFLKDKFYEHVPQLQFASVVMTMDMEFAHIDGYYGIKVYNAIYSSDDPEKEPIGYWTPLHGRWSRDNRSKDIYEVDRVDKNPLKRYDIIEQTDEDFAKNRETMKTSGVPGVYFDDLNKPIKVNVKAAPFIITEKEKPPQGDDSEAQRLLYEQWKDQLFKTKLATVSNPLKLLPMFHYDPRRWQVQNTRNAEPFEQVGASGMFLGFKIYTAQGYRPADFRRLPVLLDFYARCCTQGIPIMNHCTPEGAPTFDRSEYILFRHPRDTKQDDEEKKKFKVDYSTDGEGYFNEHFVSPQAWDKVLNGRLGNTRFHKLRLCLAHFGGATTLGIKWIGQIIDLMKRYPNLYTDISSSMTKEGFKEHFKENISKDKDFNKLIRHRILFGTDWYLTLMADKDYKAYCEEAKAFLDGIDASLWVRFTQANPYRFYRLDQQIGRIANAIINTRRDDEDIQKVMEPFEPEKIAEIHKKAAYIEKANESFIKHEETQKT